MVYFHLRVRDHPYMTFEPFSNHPGLYAVQLKVYEEVATSSHPGPGSNSAFCYFEVGHGLICWHKMVLVSK